MVLHRPSTRLFLFLAWALLVVIFGCDKTTAFSACAFSLGRQTLSSRTGGGAKKNKSVNTKAILVCLQTSTSENENPAASSNRRRLQWKSLAAVAISSLLLTTLVPGEQDLIHRYRRFLSVYPLRTKVATGAVLAVVGDALAQSRLTTEKYDSYRAASFAAFDSCYRVFQHVAFPLLVGKCRGRFLGSMYSTLKGGSEIVVNSNLVHFLAATEQTIAYQLCIVPLLYYPVFFTFTGFMQGLTANETLERMKRDFIPCWKRNLCFWVPMQFYMFGFLEAKWQIPFSCVMGIVWSTILSAFAGRAGAVVTCVGDECDVE